MNILISMLISSLAASALAQTTPAGVITLPPGHRITPFTQRQSCPPGEHAIVIKLNNLSTMHFTRMTSVRVQDLHECIQVCLMQENCAAFTYIEASNTCKPQSELDLVTLGESNNDLYIKQCVAGPVPVAQCASEPALAFEAIHGTVLLGFAVHVVQADSYEQCLESCLNSQSLFEFDCLSINFYPTDQECVLNSDKASKRKDLVYAKETDPVIYFERLCTMSDSKEVTKEPASIEVTPEEKESTTERTEGSPNLEKSSTADSNDLETLAKKFDEKIEALTQMLNELDRRVNELEQQSDTTGFRWQRVAPPKSN